MFLACRKRAGLSQEAVAKAMGCSAAAVSLWESGDTAPVARSLPALAKLYGVTVDELLEGEADDAE